MSLSNIFSPKYWIEKAFALFDIPLLVIVLGIFCVGMLAVYSAGFDFPGRFADHLRNIVISVFAIIIFASISPQIAQRIALPLYLLGVILLIGVELFGITKNGSTRWLNLGITVIQPSEIMKIAVPLMLAWFFQHYEERIASREFIIAFIVLCIPAGFVFLQPDLGTALLIMATGLYVIFLAGFPWKMIILFFTSGLLSLPLVWNFVLHDYQRERVLTLIDPAADPLGKGFHIIQSMIAIGSGGFLGKGLLQGTQSHLEFIPERTTDFIFAVFSEEFGFLGNMILLFLYFCFLMRGLMIARNAPSLFTRLLAGAITLMCFTYIFVNIGMVSGILPVVGVPLPLVSYGGTAFMTIGVSVGILMSIKRHRKLVQS